MSKKKEPKVKERINWRKEASLLPGYIIVLVWIIFTAAFLLWILGASLSTSREIFSGSVFKFESGLHFEKIGMIIITAGILMATIRLDFMTLLPRNSNLDST